MKFILRLFPEISIKSRPVRNRLIKLLSQNILNVAKHRAMECHVYSQWDKLIVRFGEKERFYGIFSVHKIKHNIFP